MADPKEKDMPSDEETAMIKHAVENLGKDDADYAASFFAEGFRRRFGISLRTEPADMAFFEYSPSGEIIIRFKKQEVAAVSLAAPAERYAFQLYIDADGDVAVRAGTVNLIEVDETDEGISPSNGLKLWIKVVVDEDGIAISAIIQSGSAYPEDDEENGYQPLGSLTVTDGNVILPPPIVHGGLRHQMCGASIHLFGGLG